MAEAIVTDPTVTGNAPIPAPFVFEGHNIRTIKDDFLPWFVAKDVCAALGISWKTSVLASMPPEWKKVLVLGAGVTGPQKHEGGGTPAPKKHGGLRSNTPLTTISEPAVYKLAFRSNKPEADRFTNWIASEVIPAIRKTGQYQVAPATPSDPPRLTTAKERNQLTGMVNRYVGLLPGGPNQEAYKAAWRRLHDVLGIKAVEELTVEQLPRAVLFVKSLIDTLALEAKGEPQKALPAGCDAVTLRDYARFYGNLPENPELWHRLEHRAVVAYEAFRKEVLAIHEAAYAPFHERRVSNVGNYFDDVVKPSREMMRMAGENAHLALRLLYDGIQGMAAAWRLLVQG